METSAAMNQAINPERTPSTGITILSGFVIFIGIAAFVALIVAVSQNSGIQSSLDWSPSEEVPERPSLVLAFLEDFGLVIPFLVITLSGFFVLLGVQLRRRDVATARWTQTALFWLFVGVLFVAFFVAYNAFKPLPANATDTSRTDEYTRLAGLLAALVPIGAAWYWLTRNMSLFTGLESLRSNETRLAWNLLIPTLSVIIFVAARPLEQTFIQSLTDKRFAGSAVPAFVGLDNYQRLLGFRFDVIECRTDDDGTCSRRDNGDIRWELIDREYLLDGYRTVREYRIPLVLESNQALALSGRDETFLDGLLTTLMFTVASVSLELGIGLFIALVVNSKFSGRGFMRAVMLIPWAIPTVISARLWELILKDTSAGIINRVAIDLGFVSSPQAWLVDPDLQLSAAVMIDVWKTSPFMALILLAGLQTIPKELYEAAAVDGASAMRRLFSITLPLLRPAIAVALVFRTLDALRVFDLFIVLYGQQKQSMATYNYTSLVNNQEAGYASAISVIIFIFISIFAFIYVRILNVETD